VTRIRPFVLTSGRVSAEGPYIGLETQVTAHGEGVPTLAPEMAAIVSLCAVPTSVAEISAKLRLHYGVARILVSDLHVAGHLDVYSRDVTTPPDPDLILRVIRGLRDIT
jgi:hypothetical protein